MTMGTAGRTRAVLPLILLAAAIIRAAVFFPLNRVLPMTGLYVDEITYSSALEQPGTTVFSRPPGMFAFALLTGASDDPLRSRMILALISLIPAAALYVSFGRTGRRWTQICTAGLAFSPFLILSGFSILPAVPAAALISLALLSAFKGRTALSGIFMGAACLFRAELLIALPILLLLSLSTRSKFREWLFFLAGVALPVVPIIMLNLMGGGGPVIAQNGGENLWLGTSWDLLSTPPGVEYEELVSVHEDHGTFQEAFIERAVNTIREAPGRWLLMGLRKGMAFFSLPGPGRNMETGMLMRSAFLVLLLPLTLIAIAFGAVRCFDGGVLSTSGGRLAVSLAAAGLVAAVIFFPAARFRTAVLPAFWFLTAWKLPVRREILPVSLMMAGVLSLSLLDAYPGAERSGLNHLLAAEHSIRVGDPDAALDELDSALTAGYEGADHYNLRGVGLSLSGRPLTGLDELIHASEEVPNSPTVWKNLAVAFWNLGHFEDASAAAERAIALNPLLRSQLLQILVHQDERMTREQDGLPAPPVPPPGSYRAMEE